MPSPIGRYSVRNIRVCGGVLSVTVADNGTVKIDECPAGVTVTVAEPS
jgi:hypothetical protein